MTSAAIKNRLRLIAGGRKDNLTQDLDAKRKEEKKRQLAQAFGADAALSDAA